MKGQMGRKNENSQFYRDLAFISSAGMSFGLCIVIGLLIGLWLDKSVFGSSPWCTLIFLGFGIAAGYRNLWLIYKRAKRLDTKPKS